MTPAGSMTAIQNDLAKLSKERRIDRLQAYLRSPRFRELLLILPPESIERCMKLVARIRASCKLPARPKPIGQSRFRWTPPLKAKLAATYAKFGPTAHVPVAAEMGLTEGQVRLAKRRFLDNQAALQQAA